MVGVGYKVPSTGRESHMSGMEIIEKRAYEAREKTRLARLKGMKSCIDNAAPPRFDHILRNRKKQMQDVDRFSEIERENYRLLARMSSIMTHQHMEDYIAPLCPALDKMRQRHRANRQVAGENAVMKQRIEKVKSHYDIDEWKSSMKNHDHALMYLCKYPRVLEPLSDAGVWADEHSLRTRQGTLRRDASSTSLPGTTVSSPGRDHSELTNRRSMSAMDYVTRKDDEDDAPHERTEKESEEVQELGRPETSVGMTRESHSRRGASRESASSGSAPMPPSLDPEEFERQAGGPVDDGNSSHSGQSVQDDDGFSPPSRPGSKMTKKTDQPSRTEKTPAKAKNRNVASKNTTSRDSSKTKRESKPQQQQHSTSPPPAPAPAPAPAPTSTSTATSAYGQQKKVLGGKQPVVRESLRDLRKRKQATTPTQSAPPPPSNSTSPAPAPGSAPTQAPKSPVQTSDETQFPPPAAEKAAITVHEAESSEEPPSVIKLAAPKAVTPAETTNVSEEQITGARSPTNEEKEAFVEKELQSAPVENVDEIVDEVIEEQ